MHRHDPASGLRERHDRRPVATISWLERILRAGRAHVAAGIHCRGGSRNRHITLADRMGQHFSALLDRDFERPQRDVDFPSLGIKV
jgi:hypothetical protein